jgi:iron complex transport system permease protein
MKRWSGARLVLTLLAAAAAMAAAALLCLIVGSTGVHWPRGQERLFRLESATDSALIGLALAVAGVAYQAILRNPLADPYLLGVSSGASLAAYVWRLPAFALAGGALGVAAVSQQAFAFAGAILAVAIVLTLAGRRGRIEPVTLLLVGVIVNAINGSIFLLLNAVVRDLPGTGGPMTFLVGDLQEITSRQRGAAAIVIFCGALLLLQLSGQLNVAALDDAEATALGVRIHRLRWISLICASLVTAAAVCIGGPIGFVGLLSPHVGRLLVGPDQRRLLPISAAIGAILLMAADGLSRYLAAVNHLGTRLPVGVLTGLLGGPFFLWLLFQSRRRM